MPDSRTRSARWALILHIVLMGFVQAHLLEDFAFDVPERFGLEDNTLGALPVAVLTAVEILVIAWTARGEKRGYLGSAIFGVLWVLAAAFDHWGEVLFEWPYRGGVISKALVVAITLGGLALAGAGFLAWREAD